MLHVAPQESCATKALLASALGGEGTKIPPPGAGFSSKRHDSVDFWDSTSCSHVLYQAPERQFQKASALCI